MVNRFIKYMILWGIGGLLFQIIEILSRGWTHWSMFILGGVCFVAMGGLNEFFSWKIPLPLQMLLSALITTILEFITGCVVNIWFGWNVWDYTNEPFNFLGQICIGASVIWFMLSGVGIILDDYLRYWMFKEEKPKYKFI